MAKRVSKRKQEKVLSPTELRRKMLVERKQREEARTVLAVLVPVLVLLVAFLGYGAYAELWREPRAPIARVEGETITAGRFQERIGWERVQLINSLESLRSLALSTDPSFLNNMAAQQRSGLAQSTVDRMIDEALIRQEAEARGITVTEREVRNHIISTTLASILLATPEPIEEEPMTPIDEELEDGTSEDAADGADDAPADAESDEEAADAADAATEGAGDEDATASLPNKPTDPDEVSDEDFDNAVENYLTGQFTTAGITREDFFEIQRQSVYREKLNRSLGEEIETTAPQIELDFLLFRDKATADAAAAALAAGQSWDDVVEEYGPRPEEEAEDASADDTTDGDRGETDADAGESVDDAEGAEDEAVSDEADDGSATQTTDDAEAVDDAEPTDEAAADGTADADSDAEATAEEGSADGTATQEASDEEADAATSNAADDEASADDVSSEDDAAGEEAEETEAEPTASPSPIPAPTAQPFAFETGERRWYSRQQAMQRLGLNEANADTLMSLETEATTDAIQGSRGFYVFRALDQEEARQLEQSEMETLRSTAIDDWLEAHRLTADIQRFAYEDKVPAEPDWFVNAYNQITGSSAAMPTLSMPEVAGTAVPAPVEQEAPAPAGGEDASDEG